MGTIIGGIPALASLPFASIPPATRLIAKCSCDLILILSAAFTRRGKFVTKQDFEESLAQYSAKRGGLGADGSLASIRALVHGEIDRLVPIHTVEVYEPLSIAKMRNEFQRIVARHRFTLDEEFILQPEDEEVDVGIEDVRGLDQWIDRKDRSAASGTFLSSDDRSVSQKSLPDLPLSESASLPSPQTPHSSHVDRMNSMERAIYEAGHKAYHDHPNVAELPGSMMKDPWHGGLSELQGSVGPWYPGMSELP